MFSKTSKLVERLSIEAEKDRQELRNCLSFLCYLTPSA